jgi:hypothetical protein
MSAKLRDFEFLNSDYLVPWVDWVKRNAAEEGPREKKVGGSPASGRLESTLVNLRLQLTKRVRGVEEAKSFAEYSSYISVASQCYSAA